MRERWMPIDDFPGYEVSNTGKVRSYWKKQKRKGTWGGVDRVLMDKPVHELLQSDDGNGYLKVFLQNNRKRRCVKVHRLVAEVFIPIPEDIDDPTVDHIKSGRLGKLDNSIKNLRWVSRKENIQKAYRDGVCDERIKRSRKEIILHDIYEDKDYYFESIGEIARYFHVDNSTISHIMSKGLVFRKQYIIEHLDSKTCDPKDYLIEKDIGGINRYA